MRDLNIVTNYRQVSCSNYAGFKSNRFTHSYKPSFLFVGHRQIMPILNRRRRMFSLIRVCTVCLQNVLLKLAQRTILVLARIRYILTLS